MHNSASDQAGSARGFCGILASQVRSGRVHRVRRPDMPTSILSIGLRGADLASRSFLLEAGLTPVRGGQPAGRESS
jgi:hypothetical protein